MRNPARVNDVSAQSGFPTPAARRRPGAVALLAGAAAALALAFPLLAQPDPRQDTQGQDSGEQQPRPQEGPGSPGFEQRQQAEQERESRLRRLWGNVRGQGAQPGVAPAQPVEQPVLGAEQPADAQPAPPPPPAELGEFIDIPAFAEAVELAAFVDWVAKVLNVNIFSDPGLAGQTVVFNGPMRVHRDELLELLSLLLEQKGFAITQDRPGWYVVKASANIGVGLGEGELTSTRVIATPLLRPSAIKPAIDAAVPAAGGAGGAATRIAYIDELGIIIATDTPRNLRAIQGVVDVLLAEQAALRLNRFELLHISAELTRAKVIELAGGAAGQAFRATAANPNQPIAQPAVGAQGGSFTNLTDRLIVDPESNSIIFRGTEAEAAALGELIAAVDAPSRLIGRRYTAGPASAQIASIGERRGLGPVTAAASGGAGQRGQFTPSPQRGGAQQGSGVGFVLEESAEAFVYFGTESQHNQVEALVREFADAARQARVVVEFYKLRHANAEDVADIVTALIQETERLTEGSFMPLDGRRSTRTRPRVADPASAFPDTETAPDASVADASGAPAGAGSETGVGLTPSEEISIQPDVSRNQVIVKAPVRQQREIATIIQKLDQRRPQVMVEVQIVAVNTTDDFRFAIEGQFTPGQAVLFTNFGLTTAGTNPPGSQPAQAPRNVATGLAGLTTAIIRSDSVPVVINALQTVGDTRIVSNPQILVNDNEEAELISAREEPFAQTVQGTSTTQTSQGGVAEAGTTLTITPQISEGNLINLEYALELSSFDRAAATTPGLQPPKQKENYESIVTLPSDATMVIGGLTTENLSKSVRKVPFLGDIPIIGELFRDTRSNKGITTIYVFIRPVIVRDAQFNDLRLLTQGPLEVSDVKGDTPALNPVRMDVTAGGLPTDLVPAKPLDVRPVRARDDEDEDSPGGP